MKFLEFICRTLMGPPASSRGDGDCSWPCPNCGHESFHTMPHRPEYKDRFRCFRCPFRGDEFDILLHFYPRENYGDRLARVEELRREFEASRQGKEPVGFSRRGSGSSQANHVCMRCKLRDPQQDEFEPEANAAIKELRAYLANPPSINAFCECLKLVEYALEVCARHQVHPKALARRVHFEEWTTRMDREHLAECSDPQHCDDAPCRAARGLEPLTAAQVRAGLYKVDGHSRNGK